MSAHINTTISLTTLNVSNELNRVNGSIENAGLSIIDNLCLLFLNGSIDRSIPLTTFWSIIALTSLFLNSMAFHFFWQTKNNNNVHENLLLNLLICHMSAGFVTQTVVAVLFAFDSCFLRAVCVIGTIITSHFSLISYTFLSFNQFLKIFRLSNRIVMQPGRERFLIFLFPCTWIYCGLFVLLKILSPTSRIPILALFSLTLLLIILYVVVSARLRSIRRNILRMENQEDRNSLISLASQIDNASATIIFLLIVTAFTWLPGTIVTIMFRFGLIKSRSTMHVALKTGLHILFLAPSLDVICLLMRTPRLRRAVKRNVIWMFSFSTKISPER